MKNKIKYAAYIVLAAVGFWGFQNIIVGEQSIFGLNSNPDSSTLFHVVYGYAITLVGVLLGTIYRNLQTRKEAGEKNLSSTGSFLKDIFTSLDLWMSICGSPIVYALIWKSLIDGGSIADNLAGLTIIALQNGFCCTILLSNLKPSVGTQAR